MSGTPIAYPSIDLRACYAVSGSDIAYPAVGLRDVRVCCYQGVDVRVSAGPISLPAILLRPRYTISGTDTGEANAISSTGIGSYYEAVATQYGHVGSYCYHATHSLRALRY
eukprot:3633809-Rhodomonas_salina.2